MRRRGLDLEGKTKVKLLEKMSEARFNKMPREMSAGGSSDGLSGGGRRKLMSEAELAQEEASIKMTMSYLEKRLFVVQEERASLERASFDAAAERASLERTSDEASRASRSSRDSAASGSHACERCRETSIHDVIEEYTHKTVSGSWRRSRMAKKWCCEECAREAGVGGY